jgi:gluconolactonase
MENLVSKDLRMRTTEATFVSFLEGPAACTDGVVFFSDIRADRIYTLWPNGTLAVFREPSGRANGNTFDLEGRLVTCEGAEHGPNGGRRLVRTDLATGVVTELASHFEGCRLNSPNDVTCDELGRLFFTDPRYGDRSDLELTVDGVYRLDPDGSLHLILDQEAVERPNGIAITPDANELYVVDSNHAAGGNRRIWSFQLDRDGNAKRQRLVYDFAPGRGGDGMELDSEGTLYVCAGINKPRTSGETNQNPPGVYVISPGGVLRDVIQIPQDVITNCCFGGSDLRMLYVTAGHLLFAVDVTTPGYHAGR